MTRQVVHEHDGDCYIAELPDCDEIRCVCEKIVLKEEACECEICNCQYCPGCGTRDYKQTGWFVCINCLSNPELVIDALIEQFWRMDDQIKLLKEEHEKSSNSIHLRRRKNDTTQFNAQINTSSTARLV